MAGQPAQNRLAGTGAANRLAEAAAPPLPPVVFGSSPRHALGSSSAAVPLTGRERWEPEPL